MYYNVTIKSAMVIDETSYDITILLQGVMTQKGQWRHMLGELMGLIWLKFNLYS